MKSSKAFDPKEIDFSISNVRFLRQSYLAEGDVIDYSKKARPTNGFLFLNSCDARLFLSGKREITVKSGNCIYLPRGSRYQLMFFSVTDQVPTFLINLAMTYEREPHRLYKEPFVLPEENSLRIKNIFSKLNSHTPSSPEIKSAAWQLISLWLDSEKEKKDPSEKAPVYLRKAKDYMEQNVTEDLSITHLAKMHGVSSSYFRKEFRRYFGVSPKEYSLQCRLNTAKAYLETGELNVSEVSKHLAFSSPSYFSRLFKEKNGVSPIAFMKNSRR